MTLHAKPTQGPDLPEKCAVPGSGSRSEQAGRILSNRCAGLSLVAVFASIFLAGCYQQAGTRYPTLGHRPAYVERKSYELHDPFPAEDMGPDTFSRPRGFTDQRTSPRRANEARVLQGLNSDYIPSQPPPPASGPYGYGYPNVVAPQ